MQRSGATRGDTVRSDIYSFSSIWKGRVSPTASFNCIMYFHLALTVVLGTANALSPLHSRFARKQQDAVPWKRDNTRPTNYTAYTIDQPVRLVSFVMKSAATDLASRLTTSQTVLDTSLIPVPPSSRGTSSTTPTSNPAARSTCI